LRKNKRTIVQCQWRTLVHKVQAEQRLRFEQWVLLQKYFSDCSKYYPWHNPWYSILRQIYAFSVNESSVHNKILEKQISFHVLSATKQPEVSLLQNSSIYRQVNLLHQTCYQKTFINWFLVICTLWQNPPLILDISVILYLEDLAPFLHLGLIYRLTFLDKSNKRSSLYHV